MQVTVLHRFNELHTPVSNASKFKEHVYFVYKISWGALVGTLALYGVVAMVVQWVGTIVAHRTLGKVGALVVEALGS